MLPSFCRSVFAVTLGVFTGVVLAAVQPATAADAKNPVEIREWKVPYEGRARDPFVAGPDEVWFVGQTAGYLARLTPSSGTFFKRELEDGAGPHNLIVSNEGIVWFAGNLNGYIGRYDPKTDKIERIKMPDENADDPHTLVFDADQSHIWFTVQGGNFVGRLKVDDRSVDLVEVPTPSARPYGIRIAPDGTPWIALFGTNKLASLDPKTLKLTEYTIPNEDAMPRRLEITEDGRIWYGDYARGKIGSYDPKAGSFSEWSLPSGEDSAPYGTALDNKGRVWLVETGVDPNLFIAFDTKNKKIVSISPVPSGGGSVRHMDFDPREEAVWFGTDAGMIGKAELSKLSE